MHLIPRSPRKLLPHALAWLVYIVYEQIIFLFSGTPPPSLVSMLLNYLLNILLFYVNSQVLLPQLFERRRYGLYAGVALALLALYALLRSGLYLYLVPTFRLGPVMLPTGLPLKSPFEYYCAQSFYRGVFFQILSTGYWFARRAVLLEKQQRLHEESMRLTERSLLEANLAFLKSQINPHFLFNSLNFLYAQVYPHSEQAAQGILLLAETMRYALHEENQGKVMLEQEIKHLHNYIALNQLRFNRRLHIEFEQRGSGHFLCIIPLILITFVENCFKHGELTDPLNPLRIHLEIEQNRLTFKTHNKKRRGPKELSTGIGLANTRQRLDLLYAGHHSLEVDDAEDSYTCSLNIYL